MRTLLIPAFLICCTTLLWPASAARAQRSPSPFETIPPISIAYMGHYAIQPGFNVGARFDLNSWEGRRKTNTTYVSPNFGYFEQTGVDENLVFRGEVGVRRQKEGRRWYSAYALSLAYLRQNELLSFSVNLGNGSRSNEVRETNRFIVPTLGHEIGWEVDGGSALFMRYDVGMRFSGSAENSLTAFLSVGAHINIAGFIK